MKRASAVALVVTLVLLLVAATGCGLASGGSTPGSAGGPVAPTAATAPAVGGAGAGAAAEASTAGVVAPTAVPTHVPTDVADAIAVTLGETILVDGPGASVDGSIVTITAGGAYRLSGTLPNGQIRVDPQDEETVTLVLDGVDITCSTSAPIDVVNAEDVVIVLAEGSENRLVDGDAYTFPSPEEDEPNATLFSRDDLTIGGTGALTIDANYHDALTSKDDLTITGGTIIVDAVGDGIRGRDALVIAAGTITVNAMGDGLESNNDEDPERGVIAIEGGTLDITAGEDGVEAETRVTISGGSITLSSGGGSANSSSAIGGAGNTWGRWPARSAAAEDDASPSAKGIKAGADVTITDGTIHIDASDDAIHSNGSIAINGGDIRLASGDDGVHADADVTIDGGDLAVSTSFEGIEGATITIGGGNVHLVASDDGINVAGGVDGSSLGGRPGQNAFASSGARYLHISGGYVAVYAAGDGLDVNGAVEMSGGTAIVHGPTGNMNGALDYDRGFTISGGLLVAVGSSGMAQAPDASSSQNVLLVNLASPQPAGTLVRIEGAGGEGLLTFAPSKDYQSVVLSSPDLAMGATYVVYTGGGTTAQATDGLYTDEGYTPGTQVASVTIAGPVTGVGAPGGGFGRGPRRP